MFRYRYTLFKYRYAILTLSLIIFIAAVLRYAHLGGFNNLSFEEFTWIISALISFVAIAVLSIGYKIIRNDQEKLLVFIFLGGGLLVSIVKEGDLPLGLKIICGVVAAWSFVLCIITIRNMFKPKDNSKKNISPENTSSKK